MTVQRFVREVVLPVDAEEAFAWHARPGAFERLLPPWQRIAVLERPAALVDGSRLAFALRRGPLRWRWLAEHADVEAGRSFTDVQVAGPFASWRHRHLFTPLEAGSLLRDEVEYALPLGAAGRLLGGALVRRELERVFAFRHRVLGGDLAVHRTCRDLPRLTVAIAGSSGLVGAALAAFLTSGGHRVLRLVRRPPRAGDEVGWHPDGGVADGERLEGVDALVYLAGESIAGGRWTARRKARLVDSRVGALRRLVASLRDLDEPPRILVSASAVGVYGDRGDEPLDEASAVGKGFLADLVRAWEGAAAEAGELGTRVVSLRYGVVLSPAGGALAKMLPAFRLGAGGPLGSGRQYLPWIGLDDAVGVVHHALVDAGLAGAVNAVAPEAVRQADFARRLGRALGRPAFLPAPAGVLRLALGEMADEALLASARVQPARLAASGYRFRHPELDGALAHVLGIPAA